jgi:hypothetical protein
MSKMGPATVACKNCKEKNLPWNWTVFLTNPQEGIGCPSAHLRRGPDRVVLELQGAILNVAPVSTKYLSRVSSSVRKMSPTFAGKSIAMALACVDIATEPVRVRLLFSLPTKYRVKYT